MSNIGGGDETGRNNNVVDALNEQFTKTKIEMEKLKEELNKNTTANGGMSITQDYIKMVREVGALMYNDLATINKLAEQSRERTDELERRRPEVEKWLEERKKTKSNNSNSNNS